LVRREMEKLIEAGKVKVTEAEKERAARLYSLAA
jgi:16S rRNA U516 pseudouridylate synthase RsuA-like enzyme